MKNNKEILLALLSLFLIIGKSFSQGTQQTVKITNLEYVKGDLYVGWYKDPATFRINEKAIYREKIVVKDQAELSVVFKNIPKGKYAIAIFLDENDNYKLDKNLFGIPKEKYGFSNNILPALRPARFDESVFDLNKEEMIIKINLK